LCVVTVCVSEGEVHSLNIDSGDTAWILTSSALVLLMTPGLAFFYGGLVRRKNALATIMQSFIIIGIVSVQWMFWGYSLAFGPDVSHGLIGNLSWWGLNNVGQARIRTTRLPSRRRRT